jgi:hypothetical protein
MLSLGVSLRAGDAVIWDADKRLYTAQYSSTPPGGRDYQTGDQAAAAVEATMKKKGVANPVLIWQSDRTGYFSVWSATNAVNKAIAAVGFGHTEAEAKAQGFTEIRKAGAKSDLFIAHRYTSHGSDYVPGSPLLPDLDDSAVENEGIDFLSPDGRYALSTSHSRGWKLRRMDLVDLQTFERVLEFGMPMALTGSVTWSRDGQRLAFFGEERAFGDTNVYQFESGKWNAVPLPDRSQIPDPPLPLNPGERVLKTKNDALRPKAWLESGDLELEHVVDVVLEKNFEAVAMVEATTSLTIHFDSNDGPSIVSVAQNTTRKAIEQPPNARDLPAKNVKASPGAK